MTKTTATRRGNGRHVVFEGHPDNLHWVWDTGLIERMDRNPKALAQELERRITDQDRAAWTKGTIEDWGWKATGWRKPWPTGTVTVRIRP